MLNEIKEKSEIGDYNFPLEVHKEKDLETDHPHVNERAVINSNANEVLSDDHGEEVTITGVYTKFGQIVGYRADLDGNTIYAPKKDFYVHRNYVEDIHVDSALACEVKKILSHWQGQHDYMGPKWDGIELINFELAKVFQGAHIESGGWYEYSASSRPDMDGKDWRYYVPDKDSATVINFHSILHDSVWTLNTTTHSTREVDRSKLDLIGSEDHWQRTLTWTIRTAEVLQNETYGYEDVIENLKKRKLISKRLTEFGKSVIPEIAEVYRDVTGNDVKRLKDCSIGLSSTILQPGKVGRHIGHTDAANYSIMAVHPKALERGESYTEIVVKHELIHFILNQDSNPTHNEEFVEIGKRLGIPEKYLD